jgi:hypothetical protein
MTKQDERLRRELERFSILPDEAHASPRLAAVVLDISQRTVRYHPALDRIWISPKRYNFRVGQIRKLLREGVRPNGGGA